MRVMSVRTYASSRSRSSSVIVGEDPQLLVWWQREERERERERGRGNRVYGLYYIWVILYGSNGGEGRNALIETKIN